MDYGGVVDAEARGGIGGLDSRGHEGKRIGPHALGVFRSFAAFMRQLACGTFCDPVAHRRPGGVAEFPDRSCDASLAFVEHLKRPGLLIFAKYLDP